jgi:NADPH:quinone reductase-like Zn-dependent oxidoreductase/acyl carrier protein
VDLDPADTETSLAALVKELLAPEREDQIAFRGTTRYVARLIPRPTPGGELPLREPYRLALPERGALDKLGYQLLEPREPGPGEVAIEVHATGLNFRDVLNVLGMYPGDPGPPGIECAGIVIAVGEGVDDLRVGDTVVGLAPRSLDAIAITRADLVARKPHHLSFAEAVTIPSAFLTAYYGLCVLANIQPGERVLIHAAAGGVGLAAVQIAHKIGAEVFATAGSPAKHAYLRSLGVEHIFSSRTPDFSDRVMDLTGSRGVDVVLNSLTDDFIPESFAAMAPQGRFLEIGKRGIWTSEQVGVVRPEAFYAPYDLGDALRDEPGMLQIALRDLLASMEDGTLKPLPLRAFPAESVVDAFRYMAQARHIGKVVVTHHPAAWRPLVQPDGAYLITGGLGGLGLQVAGWLVDQGARHVARVGRRAPTAEAVEAIRQMQERGANIQVLSADVAQAGDMARVIEQIGQSNRPLRGIIHAAGTLDDGVLAQQSWQRFAPVFAPKVAGAWNLHTLTRGAPLDFFALFSSASALLGNPGQSNYAAANAFLDAFAHQRRAAGLPAISINWGAWSGAGMAASLAAQQQERLASRGIDSIAPEQGLHALRRLLKRGAAQAAVLPVRWATLLAQFPDSERPPLFAELAQGIPARPQRAAPRQDDAVAFRKRLAESTPAERENLLVQRLAFHLAQVLGLGPLHEPDLAQGFTEFGMDSLMAVELKNRIEADLRVAMPLSALFENTSINALAAKLAAQVSDGSAAATMVEAAPTPAKDDQNAQGLLGKLDQLSDDDVDALLNEMLKEQESH